MRQVSMQEFEQDPQSCIAEAEAGQRLVLVRDGKPVVQIVPAAASADTPQLWKSEEERKAAGKEFFAMLEKGFNMGGFKIPNRDELYDRD